MFCIVAATGVTACAPSRDRQTSEHVMPEFARVMRPFCFGRLSVDVPTEAQVRAISQSIEGFGEIEVHRNLSKENFFQLADKREQVLRNSPHRKEGSVLSEVIELGDARILVFRGTELTTFSFELLGYFWKNETGYVFAYAADNDELQEAKDDLQHAITLIHPRHNSQFPDHPGFCIDSAVVSGSDFRLEQVGAAFIAPSFPSMEIGIESSSVVRLYPEDLLQRSDQNLPAVRALHPELRLEQVRRGKRTVAGLDGLELVEVVNRGTPGQLFQARWDFLGEVNSLTRPSVTISISYGDESVDTSFEKDDLSIDDLTTVWDAMLGTLRLRED